MASRSICTQVIVSQCFHCRKDTGYHCGTCGQNLCPPCMRSHTLSLDTKDHNVTLYREKFNSSYKREMCATHPDQVYEMYCETCDLPFCFHCKEHEQHDIQNIRTAYENKRKQSYEIISKIRFSTLCALQVLFVGIQAAMASYKKEKISHVLLKMPKIIKDSIFNDICREITVKYKQLLMHKVCIQKMKAKQYILTIQTYDNRCEQYVSRPVEFLRVFKKSPFPNMQDGPYLPQQFLFSLTQEISMEDLIKLLSDIRLIGRGKRRIVDEILLTLMPFPVLKKTFEVPDVGEVTHISCAESGQIWITGVNNIFLSDTTTGSILYTVELEKVSSFDNQYKGLHTVTRDYELIYIDRGIKIKKLSKDRKTTTTFIDNSNSVWKILCVYSSPFTGDLLVGMFRNDYGRKCRVGRYNSNGKLKQTIPHRNSTNKLYTFPEHVTENNNGDVVVSDTWRAVVVTSSVGRHRFSYTGPPSGSKLYPEGICTDPLSHILVCDRETHTVQMIDKDGQFMFFLLTLDSPGIFGVPQSLSYDVNTHLLFVGLIENTSVYRYIDKSFVLAGTSHYVTILQSNITADQLFLVMKYMIVFDQFQHGFFMWWYLSVIFM